jgi:GAF domain-containing protein
VLAAFAQVTAALESTSNLDDLLRVVAREVAALVGVERCSVHLRGEKGGVFRRCVGHPDDQEIDAYVKRTLAGIPADGVTLELLRTKRPVIVNNARTDPRLIRSTVRVWMIGSMMAVPLVFDDEVIGIIHLDDVDRPHVFTEADAGVVPMFASLAAAAVAHGQSKTELEAKVETAQGQVDALLRVATITQHLSAVVLSGGGPHEVVETLARLLGKPCAVYNAHHVRLAAATSPGVDDSTLPQLLEPACVAMPEVRDALSSGAPGRPFLVGPLRNAGVLHRYVVAPVVVDDELLARLVVMEHRRGFSGEDIVTLRRAAILLGLHLRAERRVVAGDDDVGASLTADLLAGRAEAAVVQRRADWIGMRLDTPRVVALIGSRTGVTAAPADVRLALEAFGDSTPEVTVHATAVAEGVAALVTVDGVDDDDRLLEATRDVVLRVCTWLGAGANIAAALSGVHSSYGGYTDGYLEARQVLECIRRFAPGPGPDVFSARDLGAGRVVLATSDREAIRRFADTTFGTMVRDPTKAHLLGTLRSFFDNMASIRRCALCLGVHENTVRYRLTRIEELTGLSMTHDPDAQLRLRLSMLVLMLEGRLPAATRTAARTLVPAPAGALANAN